jgi:hypothetical protein
MGLRQILVSCYSHLPFLSFCPIIKELSTLYCLLAKYRIFPLEEKL